MYADQLLGEIGEWNLSVPRHNPLAETLYMIDRDFTGSIFEAHIRTEPEANGTPVGTITATFVSVSNAETWQDLIDKCWIEASQIPCEKLATDLVPVSVVTLVASQGIIEGLPYPADRRDNITLAWDLRQTTPSVQTILAGDFTVIAGVTR